MQHKTVSIKHKIKIFDLVISIEGFNEHYSFKDKAMNKLSKPANTFKGVSNYYNQSFLFNCYKVNVFLDNQDNTINLMAISLSFHFELPYLSPAKMFLPSLDSDWCTCIPVPLSPTTGFGIKVAVLPKACATFCTTYLYFCTSSAFLTSVLNKVPISH